MFWKGHGIIMNDDDKTIKNQSDLDDKVNNIIEIEMNSELSDNCDSVKLVLKNNTLDVKTLYNKCYEMYEPNDSKEDLIEKLLKYIKDNRNEFKIFSTLAGDILKKQKK